MNRIGVPEQPFASEQTTRDVTIERVREIRQTLEAQGVRHAFLFGSVARGDDVPESDIDIVLDIDPDRHIGLFAFESIREVLEAQLGRNVDSGSLRSLRPVDTTTSFETWWKRSDRKPFSSNATCLTIVERGS